MEKDVFPEFWSQTYRDFSHLSDYIWKFNRQIEELRAVELAKLENYFPDNPEMQAIRWYYESQKLDQFFPTVLNYSFVVMACITIETRLMRLCDLLYEVKSFPVRADDLAGSNLERYMVFLDRFMGVSRGELGYWPQIAALTKIRNCIVHTSGFVARSRDERSVRNIITNRSYLSQADAQRRQGLEKKDGRLVPHEIYIREEEGRDRLVVRLQYAHSVPGYAREFFHELLLKAKLVPSGYLLNNLG